MGLDIRLPIGLLFLIIGALLAVFGALGDPSIYARSLGINVNLWWGLVMVVVGMAFLGLAHRHARSVDGQRKSEHAGDGSRAGEVGMKG